MITAPRRMSTAMPSRVKMCKIFNERNDEKDPENTARWTRQAINGTIPSQHTKFGIENFSKMFMTRSSMSKNVTLPDFQ
jgi:hypothetical protein